MGVEASLNLPEQQVQRADTENRRGVIMEAFGICYFPKGVCLKAIFHRAYIIDDYLRGLKIFPSFSPMTYKWTVLVIFSFTD